MSRKGFIIISLVIIFILFNYKSIFWWIRDYYYQVKLGAFTVDYELACKDMFLYRASIKKLTPDNELDKIDSNYFTLAGYLDWQRIPTVYPYTINVYNDINTPAGSSQGVFLTNSTNVNYAEDSPDDSPGGIAYENDEYGEMVAENIIAFSYNDKYLIGKTRTAMENNRPTSKSVTAYFMLSFANGKLDYFKSYNELIEKARELKYKRHIFHLDYAKETEDIKTYKELERNKFLERNETELIPFQLMFDRYFGLSIEL